ncbi:hypothetical protein [Rugamonas rivuli]|uniref:Uncharacterized protein n=1 Tax=Rugamonas rivuli TaxID=2743358 RepID=A0A843SDK2_9BURK|nr:hypothetical protein [Rugamonas rivuli]MQA21162.1 hypothetical protein [Rugamonas rivuli]
MPLVQDSPLVISIATKVLDIETNDGRFENFCREAVSAMEGGALILSTSASWDLGRDGVGYGRADGIYLCASLRDDVDAKALSDIERISSKAANIKRVYFCSSHELSEHRRNEIAAALEAEVEHKFSITVCGSRQLVEAVASNVEILNRFYGAEIEDCIRVITERDEKNHDVRGLKLALISLDEDSVAVRSHIYRSVILEILGSDGAITIEGLAKRISDRLHLSSVIAKEALVAPVSMLSADGVISNDQRLIKITEAGKSELVQNTADAATRLLDGRAVIRSAIENAIGGRLAEDHYSKIWSIFQDRLVAYFISRGETLVFEVSELLGLDATGEKPESIRPFSFVEEVAKAVADTSSSSQQRIELDQAIKDIFLERTGPAAEWLVRLCMSFIAACTLGMEHSAGQEIERVLRKTSLVLDTDVVLSLLGEGEIDHEGVTAIVDRWRRIGGKILVAEPVLEETAYHASIAHFDYDQVRHWLPGAPHERQQLIENVFVRSFAEMLTKDAKPSHWGRYIAQYVGTSNYDWSKVFDDLRANYNIEKLPARRTTDAALEERVRKFLIEQKQAVSITDTALRNLHDKARRDAQLYAAMVSYIRYLRDMDTSSTCLLMSSARRLAVAESEFKEAAEPELVTSISTVLQLLTLAPNVRLGATAMKAFLFDERPIGFTSAFERTVMRILHASDEASVPWAKRGAMMREVRQKLMQNAKSQGEKMRPDELERRALYPENQANTIQMIKQAFDAVALDTEMAKQNTDLKKRVAELEDKLRRTTESNRNAKPPKRR